MTTNPDKSYIQLINESKQEIHTSRIKAHLAVNSEMIKLYWEIGKSILENQEREGWGSKIVERISKDLRSEFTEMTGLSRANVFFMRKFAEIIHQFHENLTNNSIVHQVGRQLENLPFFNIPWRHNTTLMDESLSNDQRLWYAEETIKNGWSRNVLMHQIKSDLYKRQVTSNKTHNFHLTLPSPQSDLADNLLKDEYNFDFLRGKDFKEKELEDQLTENIVKFLFTLGKGFSFVGIERI